MPIVVNTNVNIGQPIPANGARPIVFDIVNTYPLAVQVSGDIYVDGTYFTTVYSDWKTKDFGGGIYMFFVDVTEAVRDALSFQLNDPFTTNSGTAKIDTEAQAEINITFYEWRFAGGGYVGQDLVNIGYSNMFIAMNSAKQYNQEFYHARQTTALGVDYRALSNRPLSPFSLTIGQDESEYLSVYADQYNYYFILCYDSSGNIISAGWREFQNFTYSGAWRTNATRCLPVGTRNIKDVSSQLWAPFLLVIPTPGDLEGVAYYEIYVGIVFDLVPPLEVWYPIPAPGWEPYRYRIKDIGCEDERVRVHWQGRQGGFESYTFRKIVKDEIVTVPEDYESPFPIGADLNLRTIRDKGLARLYTPAINEIDLTSEPLEQDEAEYLSEILTSPNVYIEVPDSSGNNPSTWDYNYVAMRVKRGKFTREEDKKDGFRILKFTLENANRVEVQGN